MTFRPFPAFPPFHRRSHDLVLGVPGSGKTELARHLMRKVRRAVFFDPAADYGEEGELVRAADLADESLWEGRRFLRYVVQPGDDVPDDFRRTVAACRAYAGQLGVLLVGDEVGDYSRHCDAELTRLHRNGHHQGVASLLVSQTAVDIPLTCRRTATRVFSLLQTASRDLDALADEYGDAFRESVASWRPGDQPAVWTLPTLYPAHQE